VRRDLPIGTVTFLFTDVEGSTKLLHELGPDPYAEALAAHRRSLRDAFARHGGVEVDTQGDALFYAFPTASGALEAAGEGQLLLSSGPIRVRIGIHTGAPRVTDEGYVGDDVHKGARIASAGYGGQVLLSKDTHELVDIEATDLGEHRLKDFDAPVWIFQLGKEPFPPLKTISNTNLPRPASSFVGREREVQEVVSLLEDAARLLTLTGSGGSGKTRLALAAAVELVPGFRNGVFWVGLAPLRDAALVTETISNAVGAKDGLADHVGERELLLLLDNFEQVVDAAPELSSLLEKCPNLKLLVTSRELLRVGGEVEYRVPPLAEREAVELFCTRSGLDAGETIAELCARLDSLPLPVELAAARASILSPAQILDRLPQRLDLLRGGRDADPRQATLRATIEWSYELLDDEERRLFGRLAAFAGGCTLEAAEAVADADLDTLQSLVEKSLLRHTDERFWMLETIREYAAERLGEHEEDSIRPRHLEYFLALAEKADEEQWTSASAWFPVLDRERDNIRTALDWAEARRPDAEARLACAIAYYWLLRGRALEARDRLAGVLARYESRDRIRARVLTELGNVVGTIGSDRDALVYLEQGRILWRENGDALGEASALATMGYCYIGIGELEPARLAFEQSLALREASDAAELEIAGSLAGLCQGLVAAGDIERADPLAGELYAIGTRHEARGTEHQGLHYLADCPLIAGDYAEAERRYVRALAHARRFGMLTMRTEELLGVAMSAAGQGDYARAVRLAAAAYAEKEALGTYGTTLFWKTLQERHIGGARARLEPDELAAAERAGREAPFDAVLDEVLGADTPAAEATPRVGH
jgi:predicted ATPase